MAQVLGGKHLIGPGFSAGYYFTKTPKQGFLPYISIYPAGRTTWEPATWALTSGGYPYANQLGISTQWCAAPPGGETLFYFIIVQNNNDFPLEFFFVEADF